MGSGASLEGPVAHFFTKNDCNETVRKTFSNGKQTATFDEIKSNMEYVLNSKAPAAAGGGAAATEAGDIIDLVAIEAQRKAHPLNLARTERLRSMFKDIDNDNSKDLTWDEFRDGLVTEKFSEAQAKSIFDEIDKLNPVPNSGKITNNKFDYWNIVKTIELMKNVFDNIDANKDKQITEEEFSNYFRKNKINKKKVVLALWAHMDKNKNGKINFKEWKDWSQEVLAMESLESIFYNSQVDT